MATTSGTNTCDDVSDAKALSTDARDDKGMLTIFSLGNKLLSKLEKSVEEHSDVASTLAYPTPRSMLADAAQPDTPRNCSEDAFQTPQRHQTDEKSRGCCASTYDADGFPVMSESDQEMPCDEQGEPKKHLTEPDAKHFYEPLDLNSRKRREAAEAARGAMKQTRASAKQRAAPKAQAEPTRATPKARAEHGQKRQAKPPPPVQAPKKPWNGHLSTPLCKAALTRPTSENNPRVELTARCRETNTRVHVCTVLVNVWSATAHEDMKKLAEKIDTCNWTKKQCLDLKAKLRK